MFYGSQNFDQEWHWSTYLTEAKGSDEALVDIVDASGNALTEDGLALYGVTWGGCCTRAADINFAVQAPYLALNYSTDTISLDMSIRQDSTEARGVSYRGINKNVGDVNGDGVVSAVEANAVVTDTTNGTLINWDTKETSMNIGINVAISDLMSVYGSVTQAYRAPGDRKDDAAIAFVNEQRTNNTDADPSNDIIGEFAPESDDIRTYEIGLKLDGDNADFFATIFSSDVSLATTDFTRLPGNPNIEQDYDIMGLELEGVAMFGNVSLNGSITYTDAEISGGANDGNVPQRQADFVYNLSADYDFGSAAVGINFNGTTDSYSGDDNSAKLKGFVFTNLFASYDVSDNLTFSINVNNLTDEVAVSEQGGGFHRVYNPRTTTATARLSF